MPELRSLTGDDLDAVLAFERGNREYFARSVTDRGDRFFETFPEQHRALVDEQAAGTGAFYLLVEPDGSVVGRFNLYGLRDGAADVGYRLAERVAGRGVATEALRELCRRAADEHGVRTLNASTSVVNVASQRVLEKAGFEAVGACEVAGRPGRAFRLALAGASR